MGFVPLGKLREAARSSNASITEYLSAVLIHVPVSYTHLTALDFTAVLAGVADGKYDFAISAIAYAPSRAEAMRDVYKRQPRSFGVPNAPCFIKKRKTLHRKAFRKSAARALVKNPKHGRC